MVVRNKNTMCQSCPDGLWSYYISFYGLMGVPVVSSVTPIGKIQLTVWSGLVPWRTILQEVKTPATLNSIQNCILDCGLHQSHPSTHLESRWSCARNPHSTQTILQTRVKHQMRIDTGKYMFVNVCLLGLQFPCWDTQTTFSFTAHTLYAYILATKNMLGWWIFFFIHQ